MRKTYLIMLICTTLFAGLSARAEDGASLSAPPLVLDAEKPATIFGSANTITLESKSWGAIATANDKLSIAVNVILNGTSKMDARGKALRACEDRKLGVCDVVAVFTGCLYAATGVKRVHDTRRRLKYILAISPKQAMDDCAGAGYKQCQPAIGGCTLGMDVAQTFALVKKDDP